MLIKSVKIQSYKCFEMPPLIHFESGFNIVIGKNNAGKSALLQAVSMELTDNPYKNAATKALNASLAEYEVVLTAPEVLDIALSQKQRIYSVTMPGNREYEKYLCRTVRWKRGV